MKKGEIDFFQSLWVNKWVKFQPVLGRFFDDFPLLNRPIWKRFLENQLFRTFPPGAQVRQTSVEKLQAGSYTGISITPADTNIGMNLNADQLFAQMQEGRSYEGVLAAAVSQAERGLHDMPSVDVQSITNYETAKNLLCFEVVGTEQNADMLANIPHTDVENMRC